MKKYTLMLGRNEIDLGIPKEPYILLDIYAQSFPLARNLTGKSTHLALKNSATFLPRKS